MQHKYMKKKDLQDLKALDLKSLKERAAKASSEVADLILDRNMNKLKDVKAVFKKRHDLARILTVIRQKELLGELETNEDNEKNESKKKGGVKS
jgi:ribosomal protein L29